MQEMGMVNIRLKKELGNMKNMYENILVAVDGSEEGDKAFKKALSISLENHAKLIIAHVIDTRSFATVAAYDQSIASRADDFANDLLNKYENAAKSSGLEHVVKAIEFGSPKTVIPKEITKKYDVNLIVCGATGLNAVEKFVIGSVSDGITRNAPCDVLVVKND